MDDTAVMLSFQKLDVYQRSIEFLAFARRLLQRIPKGHADLVDQLRRSAQSVPQNIAEGAGKTGRADKARYYATARGSAMESAAHLDVMTIDDEQYAVVVFGTGASLAASRPRDPPRPTSADRRASTDRG